MPGPDTPLTGDALLAAVTDAMIALHKSYHHRAPATAKTLLLGGDVLAFISYLHAGPTSKSNSSYSTPGPTRPSSRRPP